MAAITNYTTSMAWDALQNGSGVINSAHIALQAAWMTPVGSVFYSLLFIVLVIIAYIKLESPIAVAFITVLGILVMGEFLLPNFKLMFAGVLIITFSAALLKFFVGSSSES